MGDVDFHWQVQQVKQRLSEVLRAAESDGPQFVTRHGKDVAVVVGIEDYHRMGETTESGPSFLDHLLAFPKLSDEEHAAAFSHPKQPSAREIPFAGPGWE